MAETTKLNTVGSSPYEEVVVHPLVLLSVVDHFRRVEEVRGVLKHASKHTGCDIVSTLLRTTRLPRTHTPRS